MLRSPISRFWPVSRIGFSMKTVAQLPRRAFTLIELLGSVQQLNDSRLLGIILGINSANTLDGTLRFYVP